MIVQAMIETINGCKLLLRGNGLSDTEKEVLESMSHEELEQITDSSAYELELHKKELEEVA
jgi:hypothetical protein